jgi:hypothetical protein
MAPAAQTNGRDLRLDSLRGLLLVSMTANHLPSVFRVFSDQSLGIFSSAEGFIFLSGLLAGWVYTRRLRANGSAALKEAATRRASLIYRWHVVSFLACLCIVQLGQYVFGFCSLTSPQLFYTHPLFAAVLGMALLHQPGLLDILPMYCAFVLMLPWVLQALEGGRRVWVIAVSAALWLAVQWAPPIDGAPLYPLHVGTFNLFAWQFLFVLGVVIGHARAVDPASVRMRPNPVLIPVVAAGAVYLWIVNRYGGPQPWADRTFGILLNKPAMGFLRLADFGLVAYLIGILAAAFPRLFEWRPFELLGRHSLVVVAAQSVVVMVLLQFPSLFATQFANCVTSLAAFGVLFLAAAAHERFQTATGRKSSPRPSGYGRTSTDGGSPSRAVT